MCLLIILAVQCGELVAVVFWNTKVSPNIVLLHCQFHYLYFYRTGVSVKIYFQLTLLENIYGKGTSLHLAATKGSQIIESTAMLNLQQQQQKKANEAVMLTPGKGNSNMSTRMSASGDNVPFKVCSS